jgi:hypothetical protein
MKILILKMLVIPVAVVLALAMIIGLSGTDSPLLWLPYWFAVGYLVASWLLMLGYGAYRLAVVVRERHRHAVKVVRRETQ